MLVVVGAVAGCGASASPPAAPSSPSNPPGPTPNTPAPPTVSAVEQPSGDPGPLPSLEAICGGRTNPVEPLVISPDVWAARPFAGILALDQLETSKETPLRTCGPVASYHRIASLTCADGSRPLPTAEQAAAARKGNVGPGGACGHFVDEYAVACSDGEHSVFIDMYWCLDAKEFDAPLRPNSA